MKMFHSKRLAEAFTQCRLNGDVLLLVLSVSPPKTATSMMATSRFLYHEGAKKILRQPVRLQGLEETIVSLLLFVRAEDFARCSYLRTLCIAMDYIPTYIVKVLTELLPRLTGLERLELAAEEMLVFHPQLLPAFASLRTVKTLVLVNAGERSFNLIRALKSKLTSAYIYVPNSRTIVGGLLNITSLHPINVFKRSASTLEALTFGFWCEFNPDVLNVRAAVIYPKLRTLTFVNNPSPMPVRYMEAYPNLTHLHFSVDNEARPFHDFGLASSIREQREKNLSFQDEEQRDDVVSWEHLEVFTGRVFDLWMLGLAFPIPRLVLEDAPAARPHGALTDVLQYACPEQLTLSFRGSSFLEVQRSDFLRALRSEGASNLKTLKIELHLATRDRELDVRRALVSPLTLTHAYRCVRLERRDADIDLPTG